MQLHKFVKLIYLAIKGSFISSRIHVIGGEKEEDERIRKNTKLVIKEEIVRTLEVELTEQTGTGIFEAAKRVCPKKVKEAIQLLANLVTISGP